MSAQQRDLDRETQRPRAINEQFARMNHGLDDIEGALSAGLEQRRVAYRPAPGAAPRSRDEQAARPAAAPSSRLAGLVALVLALPLWMEGARTTRDGWIVAINWIISRNGGRLALPPTAAWRWPLPVLVAVVLGLLYSRIELQPPLRPPRGWRADFWRLGRWRVERRWQIWLVWLALVVSDIATMYVGARSPELGAAIFFRQIAASAAWSATYAIIITFLPEQLARFGARALKG